MHGHISLSSKSKIEFCVALCLGSDFNIAIDLLKDLLEDLLKRSTVRMIHWNAHYMERSTREKVLHECFGTYPFVSLMKIYKESFVPVSVGEICKNLAKSLEKGVK